MRKTFTFIISTLLFFVGMSSCIYDEEPTTPTLPEGIQMGFTIHVGGNKPASRGADDKVEAGNDLENRIDIANRDFRVYFYEAGNDAYIGELEIISVLDVTDNDNYNKDYYVVGRVDDQFVTKLNAGFRMVVMANLSKWYKFNGYYDDADQSVYGGYPRETPRIVINENNIGQHRGEGQGDGVYFYGSNATDTGFTLYTDRQEGFNVNTDAGGRLIPMWGIRTYTGVTLEENTITNLGTPLTMLRTMAKIEVIFDERIELPENIEVHLRNYKYQAMIEPYNNAGADDNETYQENGYNTFENFTKSNTYWGASECQDRRLKLTHERDNDTRKYVIYIPEQDETHMNANYYPRIEIQFGPKYFSFTLPDPDNNVFATTPILRNHIYRYKIDKVNLNPKIEYEVVNWDEHNIKIGYN